MIVNLDELEKLARDDSPNSGSKIAVRCYDVLKLIAVVRAANHLVDPNTQILQVTAMTAWHDLKEALADLEGEG